MGDRSTHWRAAEGVEGDLMGILGGGNGQSERALVAAVLCRAMMDIINVYTKDDRTSIGGTRPWLRRIEAKQWFAQVEPETPFSFEWCCDVLGVHPAAIRNWAKSAATEQERTRGQQNMARLSAKSLVYEKKVG